uniref:Uncharacterized protein n=1 Tax=Oryza glaberrima TaxID=4538 RepID=A0A679BCA8_ORYGL|nr:hypothetical protein [Oryza glaberrima]
MGTAAAWGASAASQDDISIRPNNQGKHMLCCEELKERLTPERGLWCVQPWQAGKSIAYCEEDDEQVPRAIGISFPSSAIASPGLVAFSASSVAHGQYLNAKQRKKWSSVMRRCGACESGAFVSDLMLAEPPARADGNFRRAAAFDD